MRQGLLSCSLWVTEWAAAILPETRRWAGRPHPGAPAPCCPRSRRWFKVPPSPSPTSIFSKQNLIRISSVHAGHCWTLTHKSARNRINTESGPSNRRERGPGLCSGPPDILSGVHVPYSLSKLTQGLLLPVIILPDSDPGSVVVKSVFQGHRGMRAEADSPDSGPTLPFY